MSQLKSYFVYSLLCLLYNVYNTVSMSLQYDENTTKMTTENKGISIGIDTVTHDNQDALVPSYLHQVKRVKRDLDANQGASWLKYVWRERQFKIPQMFLTNIRNLWAADPIGGKYLFDPEVPYGTVYLIKTLILDVLFPRIGKNQ